MKVGRGARDDEVECNQSLRGDGDGGLGRPPHRAVGRDDEIGCELAAMLVEEMPEVRAADLLLALDQEADVERKRAFLRKEGFGHLQSHEHGALVVGRAAGVDATLADGRLERGSRPLGLVAGRLHVVVAVDEDRRRAGDAESFAEHDRMAVGRDDASVCERELRGDPLGCLAHRRPPRWIAADARDA
jgi:hypothetical protein